MNINQLYPGASFFIESTSKLNDLEVFNLRKKLGVKQNVSNADKKRFEEINKSDSVDIKVTPSPSETFELRNLVMNKIWFGFGFFLYLVEDF